MFGFPASTEFNKRIPKQKFYENIKISPSVKRSFVDQVHLIYWRNKLSTTTLNVDKGLNVAEIEVLEVVLNTPQLDEALLRLIDQNIPYHTLFVLTYKNMAQAWISYKDASSTFSNKNRVHFYFHTAWIPQTDLLFFTQGLNMDAIYENFVRNIAGFSPSSNSDVILRDQINREELKQKLERKIRALEAKIKKEVQFNTKIEISSHLKKLKIELSHINHEGNLP